MRLESRQGDESVRDEGPDDYVKPEQVTDEKDKFNAALSDQSSCDAYSPREEQRIVNNIDKRYFIDLTDDAPSSEVNRAEVNVITDNDHNDTQIKIM